MRYLMIILRATYKRAILPALGWVQSQQPLKRRQAPADCTKLGQSLPRAYPSDFQGFGPLSGRCKTPVFMRSCHLGMVEGPKMQTTTYKLLSLGHLFA